MDHKFENETRLETNSHTDIDFTSFFDLYLDHYWNVLAFETRASLGLGFSLFGYVRDCGTRV